MTIQSFIEKAIEGGWVPTGYDALVKNPVSARIDGERLEMQAMGADGWTGLKSSVLISGFVAEHQFRVLLDPLAWKAVGKVSGWHSNYDSVPEHELEMPLCWCGAQSSAEKGTTLTIHRDTTWRGYWHGMLDALAEGKTIEQYLETL